MSEILHRSLTRPVRVGNLIIGGSNEVIIQSMTTTKTHDVEATVAEIKRLEEAGCQIVRVACPDERAADALAEIKSRINIPLVVDIHFDYKLALKAIESGVDKIRINPGNIGRREKVEAVVNAAKAKNIPIRIGVNAGSLEKQFLEKYGYPTAQGMVESAMHHVKILEDLGFYNTIISLKASDVNLALEAYTLAAKTFDYPLHVGITESGPLFSGSLKSAAGLGAILSLGIGSTVRVSLSDDPVEEVKVAKEVLKSFGLAANAATLISCPTCGRIEIDLISIAKEVEEYIQNINVNIKVAVLGWLLYKHRPDRVVWACLVATIVGVGLSASDVSGGEVLGVVFIVSGAVVYAVYSVIGARVMPRTDVLTGLWFVLTGAGFSFTLVWLVDPPGMPSTLPWTAPVLWSALEIAVVGTILAMGAFFAGMNRIGASKSAIIQTFEVLVTVTMGLVFLDESLTARQVLGAALILGGVILLTRSESRRVDEEHPGPSLEGHIAL